MCLLFAQQAGAQLGFCSVDLNLNLKIFLFENCLNRRHAKQIDVTEAYHNRGSGGEAPSHQVIF